MGFLHFQTRLSDFEVHFAFSNDIYSVFFVVEALCLSIL
jgi:hypothetical protein